MTSVYKMCSCSQSNLFKLFQIHFSITIQIKHLEGNLKVPLGSWIQKKENSEIDTEQYENNMSQRNDPDTAIKHKPCNIVSFYLNTPMGQQHSLFDPFAIRLYNHG